MLVGLMFCFKGGGVDVDGVVCEWMVGWGEWMG